MNKIYIMGLMTFLCSLFGCAQEQNYKSLSVDEFEKAISDTTVVRLDVRTAVEYAEGCIPGSILIDVLKDDFREKVLAQIPKDKTVALYCRTGRRSKTAANIMTKEGYKVVELNKGYAAWAAASKPIDK